MGAVVSRQTFSATGKYLLAQAGEGASTVGWQISVVGIGWTGSGVLKNPTSAPGSTLALGSAISYFVVDTGLAATSAITSAANVIVTNAGSDLYFDYTHTAGTVTVTIAAAGELVGADDGFLSAFNPAYTGNLRSVTALATPSALSATALNAFASTVSGATLMGYGTTGDVTLKNRAGTSVAYVGPNTTKFWLVGDFDIGAGKFVVTAATGAVSAGGGVVATGGIGAFRVASAVDEILNIGGLQATNTGGHFLRFYGGAAGTTTRGYVGFAHTGSGGDTIWGGELADAVCIRGDAGLQLGSNVIGLTIVATTGAATFASSLAITGALTGVTTAAISGVASHFGATAVPATAGAAAAGAPIVLYSGLLTIEATSDVPTHTRPKGSLCINTGGSSTTTRLYVNTDSAGTWTAFTTSA